MTWDELLSYGGRLPVGLCNNVVVQRDPRLRAFPAEDQYIPQFLMTNRCQWDLETAIHAETFDPLSPGYGWGTVGVVTVQTYLGLKYIQVAATAPPPSTSDLQYTMPNLAADDVIVVVIRGLAIPLAGSNNNIAMVQFLDGSRSTNALYFVLDRGVIKGSYFSLLVSELPLKDGIDTDTTFYLAFRPPLLDVNSSGVDMRNTRRWSAGNGIWGYSVATDVVRFRVTTAALPGTGYFRLRYVAMYRGKQP
jgi:hypothetical protein